MMREVKKRHGVRGMFHSGGREEDEMEKVGRTFQGTAKPKRLKEVKK